METVYQWCKLKKLYLNEKVHWEVLAVLQFTPTPTYTAIPLMLNSMNIYLFLNNEFAHLHGWASFGLPIQTFSDAEDGTESEDTERVVRWSSWCLLQALALSQAFLLRWWFYRTDATNLV